MKSLYRITVCIFVILCLVAPTVSAFDYGEFNKAYNDTVGYLKSLGTPSVGSVGGEWLVIALTRAGEKCPDGYYENVLSYVETKINEKEQLHKSKSTDNSRVILGLTSAGYDPRDVGGHDLVFGLTDMTYLKKQGPNGTIWALIALDCNNYEIPDNPDAAEQTTREGLISVILSNQLADGGWAMSGKSVDPDMTAMAIQSLAPYYNSNAEVKAAVDKALGVLSEKQHDNGGYGSVDGACSESSAQVIVALTSLGIDPASDERFIKNSKTVIDALLEFAVEGGGFSHIPGGSLNGMATEQSMYALVAYQRFTEGKNSLYDMTEEKPEYEDEDLPDLSVDSEETEGTVEEPDTNWETEDKYTESITENQVSDFEAQDSIEKDDHSDSAADNSDNADNKESVKHNVTVKPQTHSSTGETAAQTGDFCIFISAISLVISLALILRRRGSRV